MCAAIGARGRSERPGMARARLFPLLLLLAGAAVVGGALLFQYVGGVQPCELCLYQRWPYYGVIVLAVLALVAGDRRVSLAILALAALAFLAGAALAFYHVGVEQHWFAGPSACSGAQITGASVADLKAQLLARPPVRCDEVAWSLFGVSLAGWNLLASIALVVGAVVGMRSLGERRGMA
jgi:disulfide bond formation protein DsbB